MIKEEMLTEQYIEKLKNFKGDYSKIKDILDKLDTIRDELYDVPLTEDTINDLDNVWQSIHLLTILIDSIQAVK